MWVWSLLFLWTKEFLSFAAVDILGGYLCIMETVLHSFGDA